jgi:hypothetical protein
MRPTSRSITVVSAMFVLAVVPFFSGCFISTKTSEADSKVAGFKPAPPEVSASVWVGTWKSPQGSILEQLRIDISKKEERLAATMSVVSSGTFTLFEVLKVEASSDKCMIDYRKVGSATATGNGGEINFEAASNKQVSKEDSTTPTADQLLLELNSDGSASMYHRKTNTNKWYKMTEAKWTKR